MLTGGKMTLCLRRINNEKIKKQEMTYVEALDIIEDYESGKNIPYSKYAEAMDIVCA